MQNSNLFQLPPAHIRVTQVKIQALRQIIKDFGIVVKGDKRFKQVLLDAVIDWLMSHKPSFNADAVVDNRRVVDVWYDSYGQRRVLYKPVTWNYTQGKYIDNSVNAYVA